MKNNLIAACLQLTSSSDIYKNLKETIDLSNKAIDKGLKKEITLNFTVILLAILFVNDLLAHDDWQPKQYSAPETYAPSPLPDRVILTWEDNPSTTQSVSWRTDISVKRAIAQLAVANSNGRALKPKTFPALTTKFSSDLNSSHYHTVTFRDLDPETLYVYRVGDGINFTEYYST